MSIESVVPPNHLILSPPSPPALNLSQHQDIFEWVNSLHQVAKALELHLQRQSFQWIFRVDFLWDWLCWNPCCPRDSQESTQYQNLKTSVLWLSACFMIQLSHLYMTTGKTIDLTIRTFVSKVMSLTFNMLSRFVIAFLPRSKCLSISWLQSPSTVILEPKKTKSVIVSTFSPYIGHEMMWPDIMILVFFFF